MQSLDRESDQEALGQEKPHGQKIVHAHTFHPHLLHRQSLRLPIDGAAYRIVKRSMDLLIAIALLPVAMCVGLVVALVVKLDSPGPVLFRHTRVGRRGKSFELLKFRTMFHDSDHVLRDHLANDAEAWKEWFCYRKLKKDPRITRVGAFLRRSNLDEIPQLLNVLRGEMSLVGPRPVVAEELLRYGSGGGLYTAVRPGVTGLWQVSGRGSLRYERRVALDVEYVSTWTLGGDVLMLIKTVGAVWTCRGAY